MKVPVSLIRFLFEAAFIVLIAAATAVAHLGKLWIALSVGGAWLLVSVVERSAIHEHSLLHDGRFRFLFAGRQPRALDAEPDVEDVPTPSQLTVPEPPADEHLPTPLPEPEPGAPEPGEPAPRLRPVPPPEPEPEAALNQPEPIAHLPLDGAEPREWNVWELERLARKAEGRDPAHDEELVFLLLELRQFANADGQLPVGFDPIVRESFGELVYAAV